MKHPPVPPELDSVMWKLAEDQDSQAIEEFGARYPEFRVELGKRLAMVRGFQGARPSSPPPPRFAPRPPQPSGWRPLPVLAGLAALFVLGWAGYQGGLLARPASPEPKPVPVANVDEIQMPGDASVAYQPPPNQPFVQMPTDSAIGSQGTVPPPPPTRPPLTSLAVDQTPLMSAIELLAVGAGYTVMFAPGMPNPSISTDYRGMSMMDILKDLGREYEFTVFDEGNRTLLVIPAVPQDQAGMSPESPRPMELPSDTAEIKMPQVGE